MTQHVWRRDGSADDCLQYSFEETAFCRVGPHEPCDAPLRELERVSGQSVKTLEDVHAALEAYFAQIPYGQVLTFAHHLSTDITYRPVSEEEMAAALARRNELGLPLAIRDVYSNYLLTALLTELERHSDEIVFQFSFGAEPLPYETGSKAKMDTLFEIAELLERFPRLRFNVFLSSVSASQALCTIARACPNLSFSAYWWHNFFPGAIRQVMHDRLDMVALNKQVGFFSDAYCADWAYAKAVIVRQELARVLAEKVERGQYTEDVAMNIARHLFWETPQTLLGMTPGTFVHEW
jgi:glucuronate isomerase